MAQQLIDLGAAPNDGTGDTLRDAGDKVNDNFAELYTGRGYVVGRSGVAAAITGTLAETTLATVNVPANAMGANGHIEVEALFSISNNANVKTMRVKFGGTTLMAPTATAAAAYRVHARIANRNATNSQITNGGPGIGSITAANTASAIDTTAIVPLLITAQLANVGDTITLESYIVKVWPAA